MNPIAVIPTYNEAGNIISMIERLQSAVPGIAILVVDDGSPDGTADLAQSRVEVLRRTHKQGLGPAYLAGFSWALQRGYDPIIEIDADGSHQPEQLPALLRASADSDVVIGSRWIAGGRTVNWPLTRQFISRLGNLYVRMMLGMRVKDATAGFRVYRAGLLRQLDLSAVTSNGYCFQIDLTYRAKRLGARITEVPITFVEREVGVSKMNRKIVVEALVQTTKWGLGRLAFIPTKQR